MWKNQSQEALTNRWNIKFHFPCYFTLNENTLLGAFISTHAGSIYEAERMIADSKAKFDKLAKEYTEMNRRWKAVESLCSCDIMQNPGSFSSNSILVVNSLKLNLFKGWIFYKVWRQTSLYLDFLLETLCMQVKLILKGNFQQNFDQSLVFLTIDNFDRSLENSFGVDDNTDTLSTSTSRYHIVWWR